MALYKIENQKICPIERTTFALQSLKELADLQRMLKDQISIISPNTLIVAEEFGDWEDSRRRIDLLGIDKEANLIVIELKRTEDGGHMELQAIRYASMISTLTFEKLVTIYDQYLKKNELNINAKSSLLEFLEWSEPDEDQFAQEVKIILASAEFSRELTTSVMWLNDYGQLDIKCVRMLPYYSNGEILLDIQTIIPIPEAADYQVKIREKKQKEREARISSRDSSKINIYFNDILECDDTRKADIGLNIALILQKNNLLDRRAFDFLRKDRSCSFDLIKKSAEVTDNEIKYNKYRVGQPAELFFDGDPYYIARNWGRSGVEKFKEVIEKEFPQVRIEFLAA